MFVFSYLLLSCSKLYDFPVEYGWRSNLILCEMQVLEETGFDVSKLLSKDDYIEMIFGQQRVRLYIVAGVKDDTPFAPQTKKEISVCHFPF